MKQNFKRFSFGYGLTVFIIATFYFGVLSLSDWEQSNKGGRLDVVFYIIPFLKSLIVGFVAWFLSVQGFKKFPVGMNHFHSVVVMVLKAINFGVVFFCCWVGIGMFQLMGASAETINSAYQGGVIISILVSIIVFFIFLFQKKGKLSIPEEFF
ncbi:MAG TPA: hypothetical protein ENJ27_00795 [Candidatus Moranbacteria bacterium]|nr:hypothetical protein [Candidatus Moranbacteria bacterium]